MNILLLGGSNTGSHVGWAVQFQALATAHRVSRIFMGAVGSLYGLLRLLDEPDGGERPDLVIFEFALNDAILLENRLVRPAMVRDALACVADICERRGVRLLFLCLEAREPSSRRARACRDAVRTLYRTVAADRGLSAPALPAQALGTMTGAFFSDENHLTAEASRRVAHHLLATVECGTPGIPNAAKKAHGTFTFVPAEAAASTGPCRLVTVQTPIYSGSCLEVARSGASRWLGSGRLVAIMLCSRARSGVFRVIAGRAHLRKNAQSQMRAIVPDLMHLSCVARTPRVETTLIIDLPVHEGALAALPEDRSLSPAPPPAPFAEQTLDVFGVMFWHERLGKFPGPLGRQSRRWLASFALFGRRGNTR